MPSRAPEPRSRSPAAEAIDEDRGGAIGLQLGERVRQGFSHDAAAVGAEAELAQDQARALQREKLFLRAVEGDLLFVPLSTTPLRDMDTCRLDARSLRLFVDRSMNRRRLRRLRW
jgi:hypothetical protein